MVEIKVGKLTETIHIHVSKVRRLRGTKGETVTSYAKVEFDGKGLGDSAKVSPEILPKKWMTHFERHLCLTRQRNIILIIMEKFKQDY